MHLRPKLFPTCLGIALATTLASNALAGSAVLQSADGSSSTFEYNSEALRIGVADANESYAVIRDGSFYSVIQDDGRTMVIDAGSMMKGFGAMAGAAAPTDLMAEVVSLKKTGRSETVAGIGGDVYMLRIVDENGDEQNEEIVLSTDRRARELRDAMYLMMDVASKMTSGTTPENAKDVWNRLAKLDAGVLRYGNDMVITSITSDKVDDARFELPAEPMKLDGLGSMLSGMSMGSESSAEDTNQSESDGEKKPGLFSSMMGAIGGKVDRQSDRAGDSVEREIDQETDEKVDNAIGKAFGKLFGRD